MTGTAAGNVTPFSFVVQYTSADAQYILASGTTVPIVGISGIGTRMPPYGNLNDGYIAIAGENFPIFRNPEFQEAQLRLGGTVAAGDELTSDGSGFGITASSGNQVGAIALMAGTSGQVITVQPVSPGIKN